MYYSKPIIEKITTFKQDTAGISFGKFRDLFGAHAIFYIKI